MAGCAAVVRRRALTAGASLDAGVSRAVAGLWCSRDRMVRFGSPVSVTAVLDAFTHALEAAYTVLPPAWLFAILLALGNVFLFRAAVGREGHSSLYFVPWGVLGFAFGNLVATLIGSRLPTLGDVRIVEAALGAWLFLTVANLRAPG